MRKLSILLIAFYQRYISPYKGFRCAHAALHGKDSCSNAVKLIIEEHGLFRGFRLIRQRFQDCRTAYVQLSEENEKDKEKKRKRSDCCDPHAACEIGNCATKKNCDLPDLPCDCWPF